MGTRASLSCAGRGLLGGTEAWLGLCLCPSSECGALLLDSLSSPARSKGRADLKWALPWCFVVTDLDGTVQFLACSHTPFGNMFCPSSVK